MAYCTQEDISGQLDTTILTQLTDDSGAGQFDPDVVDAAIADADAEIDGYCGARYPVPFAPVPPMIAKLSTDIAVYNLFARRDNVPEARAKRYDNAIRFLTAVAAGKISLGAQDPDGTPAPSCRPDIQSDTRLFDRSKMDGF